MLQYARNVLIAFDQFCNAILGGDPGDTISYRAAVARQSNAKWACVLCRFLDLFQQGHCDKTLAATDHERLVWGEAIEHDGKDETQ
jgi:hypothetical protein